MFFFITVSLLIAVIFNEQTSAIKSFDRQERLIGPWIYSRIRRESNPQLDTKDSYERAINESISDYYAQRKAVMDRYYARQREISEKFTKNPSTRRPLQVIKNLESNNIKNILVDENEESLGDSTTERQNNTSRIIRDGRNYEQQGECKHGPNEKLVYQHNLGIGLKGPSQLDATIKVNLDGPISITCVEAFPYNNSTGILSWLGGGPGTDFVKLNLKAPENKGVSYTIKVWGVKSTDCDENNRSD